MGGGGESDAHALQRAKRLTDTLDFLFTGLLLSHGRADGISNAGQVVEGFTVSGFDAFHLQQSSFEWGFRLRFFGALFSGLRVCLHGLFRGGFIRGGWWLG